MAADRGTPTDRVDWPALLARACRGEGLRSVYQPIVDVARGIVAGYEALVRFESGPPDPEQWFAAAHRHGVTHLLDAAAIGSALAQRNWLPDNTFLTVNVSPMSLTAPAVRRIWADQGSLGGLVIELTEQTAIDSYAELAVDLRRLRAGGAMIALDDTGAGYAGLNHLLAIRPEIVKLDRALVSDIDVDEGKRALVEMMGTLTSRIDAWLLAEGVERPAELAALADLGVPLVQGYLLALPGPAWPLVEPSAALQLITSGAVVRGAGTLRGILGTAASATCLDDARAQCGRGDVDIVVMLDADHRPVGIVTPETALVGQTLPGMRINADTPFAEAALRATTRATATRFTPLLCTDDAGRFVGVVRMERLIHALSRRDGESAVPMTPTAAA